MLVGECHGNQREGHHGGGFKTLPRKLVKFKPNPLGYIQGRPARYVNPSGSGRGRYGDHFDIGHLRSQMHPKGAGSL